MDSHSQIVNLDIENVYPNPDQPRKVFDEKYLKELASSIEKYGVISPIVVRKNPFGKYMIIAGERRFRALKLLGKKYVPAIIAKYDEDVIGEIAISENLQREALSPLEEARAFKKLLEEKDITQEELASSLGKSRSYVANKIRLLGLSKYATLKLEEGKLSEAHARAILTLSQSEQKAITDKIINEGWSVRKTEKAVKKPTAKKTKKSAPTELRALVKNMEYVLKTRVTAVGNNDKGRIYIDYFTSDDLDRLVEIIELLQKKR